MSDNKERKEVLIQLELPADIARDLQERANKLGVSVDVLLKEFILQALSKDIKRRIRFH
jgi:hypothetical protein